LALRLDGRSLEERPPRVAGAPSEMRDWGALYRERAAAIRRLIETTPRARDVRVPSSIGEGGEDSPREERAEANRAVRLGVAFHEAMEGADFADPSRIPEWAEDAGCRHGLDPAGRRLLEEMMANAFRSELLDRARAAAAAGRRVLRELPFVRPVEIAGAPTSIEEGKIDLLFEEPGGWIMVDYKTDRVPPDPAQFRDFLRARYRP